MPAGCTKFHKVESGDGCWSIEQKYGLTVAQFEALNPDVGADCSAGVWLGYHYCVGKDGGSGGGGEAPTSCGGGGAFYTFPGGSISPVFHTTSHTVWIQPEPTQSIYTPDPPPRIRYSTTKDNGPLPTYESTDPNWKDKGCGDWSCAPFGCPPGTKDTKGGGGGGGGGGGCGLFGCDGGCGILGCAGLCGFFQCGCKGQFCKPPLPRSVLIQTDLRPPS
ncbi:hypothetical protein GE09DRAFT_74167 [Coniochaeta sp. 2T2.1]|nr:hypothetical protein GE09DRAFT_74167 [Coniochaeta sp. 2T2.1]